MRAPAADIRRLADRRMVWLFLAALVVLGAGIGLRDPWPSDEPRFALNALEMIETGNWLIPHRAGELYPDKPPVFMWATALAILATGSVRLGFLLPSLLAALGTLGLVVDLTYRLHGRRVAMLAGLALLATVQFAMQARSAQIDMLVTFWITLGAYGIMRHALLGPDRGWWLLGCAAMGLGVITKGVGFLPLLMVPVWIALASRAHAHPLAVGEFVAGLGVLLVVIAVWVLPMVIYTTASGDPALLEYRDNILLHQTAERYSDSWGHIQPWYYFVVEVAPWAWLPLCLALPWALPNWWRRLRRGDARTILPLSGVVLILLFFSLSPGKRGVYLLPTVPLLVLALAPLLPGLLDRRSFNRLATGILVVLGGALGIAAVLGWTRYGPLAAMADQHHVNPWLWWSLLALAGLALILWLGVRRGVLALSLWLGLLWVTFGLMAWPDLNDTRSPRDLMGKVAEIMGPNDRLAIHDFGEEFILMTRQPTVHFGYAMRDDREAAKAFDWLAVARHNRWLLIAQEHAGLLGCVDFDRVRDLGFQNSQYWWLIPGSATAGCQGDPHAAPVYWAPTSLRPSPYL